MEKLGKFKTEKSGKFHVFEAANEAGLNVGVLCALIQAGALDGFKQSRTKVVYEAQFWNLLTEKEKIKCLELADQFDHDLVNVIKELMTRKDEKGKPIIKESRIETLKKNRKLTKLFLIKIKSLSPLLTGIMKKPTRIYIQQEPARHLPAQKERLNVSETSPRRKS